MRLGLAGQNYSARSLAAAAQSCINLYPEKIEDPNERAKGIATLYGCPGRHLFKDLTTIDAAATPVRGVWSGGGRLFVAAGPRYMEISSAGALIGSVRTIANDGTPVQFFVNGNQLFIVSGATAYVDSGAGPTAITLPTLTGFVSRAGAYVFQLSGDLFDVGMTGQTITINAVARTVQYVLGPRSLFLSGSPGGSDTNVAYSCTPPMAVTTGAYLRGYFIAARALTRQFNISPLYDGTNLGTFVWDQLDFASKENYPDYIRCVLADADQLYFFGTETFEVWAHTGQGVGGFPFEKIDGASGTLGTISSWSPISVDGRIYFLASGRAGAISAYVLDGFTPRRVSTHAQESAWNDGTAPVNAYSYSYLEEGHTFWVFHVNAQTWGYDTTTGAWHQRNAWSGSAFTNYPTYYHTFIAEFGVGKHITGGALDGKLYESSVNFYDDNGTNIKWQRALPHLYNEGKRLYFGPLMLEMEAGTVVSGAEPTIDLDYSDDRGHTWSTARTAGIGTAAQWSRRVYWPTNGSSYDRVFRLSGTGQSKVALMAADLDVELGAT